jgi:hypothetical protein
MDCLTVGAGTTAPDGSSSRGEATILTAFTGEAGEVVDCLVVQCQIVLFHYRGQYVGVDLHFADVIAARPGFTG